MVLSGVKAGVTVILFDHRQTLSALLCQVERVISGQRAQRLGVLAPGGTEEMNLLHSEFFVCLCRSATVTSTQLVTVANSFKTVFLQEVNCQKRLCWPLTTESSGKVCVFG